MNTIRPVNLNVTRNETTQGLYIVNAAGHAYGWLNTHDVNAVLNFMKSKLQEHRATKVAKVTIRPQGDGILKPPAGTTTLRVYQRILPLPRGAHSSNEAVQRDFFWILAAERRELAKGKVNSTLGFRLARFVFNDTVRGEPDLWKVQEVRKAAFKASKSGDVVTLTGDFAMRTNDNKRGLEGTMTAEFRFRGDTIVSAKGIADTTAWGHSTHAKNPPAGRFPIKYAFLLDKGGGDTVAPHSSKWGDVYFTGR